ncbi:hypothetical protein F4780DRAFT_431269 [Xylariomycetidae sp. FL0641]|nr:hypothetical protein F4780DRAFT_431269 [Xylariomycetidae sp. FL0641]
MPPRKTATAASKSVNAGRAPAKGKSAASSRTGSTRTTAAASTRSTVTSSQTATARKKAPVKSTPSKGTTSTSSSRSTTTAKDRAKAAKDQAKAAKDKAKATAAKKAHREQEQLAERRRAYAQAHANVENPQAVPNAGQVYWATQLPRKRRGEVPAYDDDPGDAGPHKKRVLIDRHTGLPRAVATGAPWETNRKLERPPNPLRAPDKKAGHDVGGAELRRMGMLARLPFEIRDEVLRYVVIWPRDIPVMQRWAVVFRRGGPRLCLGILRTCKALHTQGLRLLYGENVFSYLMKDPRAAEAGTETVMSKVFRDQNSGCTIPFVRYGHLIKRVAIVIEAGRMHPKNSELQLNFAKALGAFLQGSNLFRLHTLTLELPAYTRRDLEWPRAINASQDDVPVCDYFGPATPIRRALLDMPMQWLRVIATRKDGSVYEHVVDTRYLAKQREMEQEVRLSGSNNKGNNAAVGPSDVPVMQAFWANQVRRARGKLNNLTWRLEGLALEPDRAVDELHLWRPLGMRELEERARSAARVGADEYGTGGLRSLPSSWREGSTLTARSARRSRRTASAALSVVSEATSGASSRSRQGQNQGLTQQWLEEIVEENPNGAGQGDEAEDEEDDEEEQEQEEEEEDEADEEDEEDEDDGDKLFVPEGVPKPV